MTTEGPQKGTRDPSDASSSIVLVQQGVVPRFAYTVGLSLDLGYELVFAGAGLVPGDQVRQILNQLALVATRAQQSVVDLQEGSFAVQDVHQSWTDRLLLRAAEAYGPGVRARQVLPVGTGRTIDVPDMHEAFDPRSAGPWVWLDAPWPWSIPSNSIAMTNPAAMRGETITEAARWEVGYWEMFAGSGVSVPPEEAVPVPVGVLVAHDNTLEPSLSLRPGEAICRSDGEASWTEWGERGTVDQHSE